MDTFLQDVRYALRMMMRSPGFTAIAVATLALGIGANTALFSVVNAVLLKPLPYPHPTQLISVQADLEGADARNVGFSQPELEDLQKRFSGFNQVSAAWPIDANVTGAEQPQRVEAVATSFNYFELLGAKAAVGRTIESSDFQRGFTEAAVISDGLWHRMFGADPNVLGKSMRLDGDLYRIVGVMPPSFHHPGQAIENGTDVWIAAGFAANPFPDPPVRAARFIPGVIARLKPRETLQQAQSQLDAFTAQLRQQYPNDYPAAARWSLRIEPLKKSLVGDSSTMLMILLASVGLVLLIACVNIASLLLARSTSRYREIAVRRALGAGRARLIRQTLTESVLLALSGGVLAVILSGWLTSILLQLVPSSLPRVEEAGTNATVLLFALGVSVVTGVLFGLAPALQFSDPALLENLKEGSRGGTGGTKQHRFLAALVVSEFALSLVLLVGAGLLLRSFWNLLEVHPGFDASHVTVGRVWLAVPNNPADDPYLKQETRSAMVREVLRRLVEVPGVQSAALSSNIVPFGKHFRQGAFRMEGRPDDPAHPNTAQIGSVSADYFRALGQPVLRGRSFTDADNETGQLVAVIDQSAAKRYWPNEDPLGKRIEMFSFGRSFARRMFTIVGIVGDTKGEGLDLPFSPHAYLCMTQETGYAIDVVLRGDATTEKIEIPLRREIQAVDPNLPVFSVRTLDAAVAESLGSRRFAMQMLAGFAATALLLAAIGIYGVMAYFVSQRWREIGIRIALGAQPRDVLRLILGRGLVLTGLGIIAGVAGALALASSMSTLVFGVRSSDPLTFIAGAAILAGVALAGCFIPARRATRVDPIMALRYE